MATTTTRPLTIAVIGGGPSGLFFCHAIESYVRKQEQEQQQHQKQHRPIKVVCFEKSSQPGGVWRAAADSASDSDPSTGSNTDSSKSNNSNNNSNSNNTITLNKVDDTEMYDKLWTNGASHLTEFFDYSYDEHFGGPVSVYMKRQDLLEYILGRVTKKCPNFLHKYVEFRQQVDRVVYDNENQRFEITVRDLDLSASTDSPSTHSTTSEQKTTQTTVRHFDKCIWACGENGRQNVPQNLVQLFRLGGFPGRIIHSADTSTLEQDVRGKRVLIVGGGFSSEDLSLQAIKLGVKQIVVCARNNGTEICWTKHWPMNKVQLLRCQEPIAVTENGNCIQFVEVEWTPYGYEKYMEEIESEVRNIDTIILCTGYHTNLDMLDDTLKQGFPKAEHRVEEMLEVPADFTVPPNLLTPFTGDVKIGDKVRYYPCYVHPNFYRGVLISNPNMMFLTTYGSHDPLLACDAYAWLLAGYVTGTVEIPSQQKMKELNKSEALDMLKYPYFRYLIDDNYWKTVDNLKNFWPDDPAKKSPIWDEVEYEEYIQATKMLARVMQEAKYPWSIGTYDALNENGLAVIRLGDLAYEHRANLNPSGNEKRWKTFRDVDNADQFCSLFTGTKAVPLTSRWMDTEEDGKRESIRRTNPPPDSIVPAVGECEPKLASK